MRIVIALGGNALLRRSDPMTTEVQRRNIMVAARAIAPLATEHSVVVVHGNGSQVGLLSLHAEALALAIGAAAVVLVTFVFTTLIHEPASVVALLAVLALSIGLDLRWKRLRAGRASGGTTSDVQVGN